MQPRECSVARTLELVGEKWALLAVREVFLGNRRFDEMTRRTGAPRDTLAARLRTLVSAGILERRPYSEHPARFEYHLTGETGPPLVLEHQCGHRLVAEVVCEACREPVAAGSTRRPR